MVDMITPKAQDLKAKLTHTVPLQVSINISPLDRLLQIAFYMPESQLHLHSCNNKRMNPPSLRWAERLGSIRMD